MEVIYTWYTDIIGDEFVQNELYSEHTLKEIQDVMKTITKTQASTIRWVSSGKSTIILQKKEMNNKKWTTVAAATSEEALPDPYDKSQAIAIVRQMMLEEVDSIIKTHALETLDTMLYKLVL